MFVVYELIAMVFEGIVFYFHHQMCLQDVVLSSSAKVAVGMQSGVCFGKETNLSKGESLVFLIGTNVSRR